MSLRCFPLNFGSIQLIVWERMLFEEFWKSRRGGHFGISALNDFSNFDWMGGMGWKNFKSFRSDIRDCRHDCHLWCRNGTILTILNFYVAQMPPIKFDLIRLSHGDHFRYWNGTISAILNLHVPSMSPIKFQLNPNYHSRGDVEKMWKLTTDGRTGTALAAWSKAPDELVITNITNTLFNDLNKW